MAFNESNPTGREDPTGKMASDAKSSAKQASKEAKRQATQTLDENRGKAADELDKIAHAARAAASDFEGQQEEGLSNYVAEMANSISSFASSLREKSIDDVVHDAKEIARKTPTLFLAGSIAIGLGLSRFAKASSHRSEDRLSASESSDFTSPEGSYPPVSGSTSGRADTQYRPGG